MRLALAGLALIVAVVTLTQALLLGAGAQNEAAHGALLLVAVGAMGLGALVVRRQPAMAFILLLLAGFVTVAVAGPGHRYVAASGVVAVVLAFFSLVAARSPAMPVRRVPKTDSAVRERNRAHPNQASDRRDQASDRRDQ